MRRIVSEVTNSFTTVFSLYHYLDKPTWLGWKKKLFFWWGFSTFWEFYQKRLF
jgi:hypothetical protein